MKGFLKAGFLFTSGLVVGGMAATRAVLKAMHSKDPIVRDTDLSKIIFKSKDEAEQILDSLDEIIGQYGFVTVLDLYNLAGLEGRFNDSKVGWTNIESAVIVRAYDGYLLKLPRVVPIN